MRMFILIGGVALGACGGAAGTPDNTNTGPADPSTTYTTATTTTPTPTSESTAIAGTVDTPTSDEGSSETSTGDIVPSECPQFDLQSDPDHCGTCDRSCLGGACEAGDCQPVSYPFLVQDGDRLYIVPNDIAADADNIYFEATTQEQEQDALFVMPRGGGEIRLLGHLESDPPTHIFPRGSKVYAYTADYTGANDVLVYDKPNDTVTSSGGGGPLHGIYSAFAGNQHLFFSSQYHLYVALLDNEGLRGSCTTPLLSDDATVTGNSKYFIASAGYDSPDYSDSLRKVEQSAVAPGVDFEMQRFYGPGSDIYTMVADEKFVYASTSDGLLRIDIETGDDITLRPDDGSRILRLHANRLYWLAYDNQIVSIPAAGGPVKPSIESDGEIGGFWVDDLGIAWTVWETPSIWHVAH